MNNRLISFLLVPLAGLFLLFHHAAYQTLLSQGDHGRDLYAFVQTLHGQMPYRDYWWVYGPIMPYYYALFLKIFGIAIPSVLIGKIVLTVLSGVFIFLSLSLFIPTLFAFMAAMWFWMYQPDFFFTYNHIGGIFCLTGITFALFSYIKQPRTKFLYFGLFFVLLLAMVKVNFGIAALFVFIAFYRLYDHFYKIPPTNGKKTLGQVAAIGVPLLILMTYFLLLFLLPVYEIRQCMPYMSNDQPYHSTPLQALGALASAIITTPLTSPANFVFAIFIIGAIIASLIKVFSHKTDSKERKQTLTAFVLLGFFYFINLHEYIVSGVLYRSFWATPFSTMMLFFVIGYSLTKISPKLQRLVFGSFFVLVFTHYVSQIDTVRIKKIPEQFLTVNRGHITTGNSEEWFTTVQDTTNFIQTHIAKEESFFALPYDPLYYYLTNKTSPTRQLIFFNHINIPPQQEATIIAELERKDVKYILISNRAFASQEPGLGFFGQSYCPLLGKYIAEHFEPIAQFGDWKNEPGWAWNHGTKIFKRVR
ncbi:MAG: hypothetical protein H6754_04010 [Candidatus Omnitrophica bacterium]|nr:hypothetical protein [Candidatus Omnitrophota bacterium]